jgi:hypothetical protein
MITSFLPVIGSAYGDNFAFYRLELSGPSTGANNWIVLETGHAPVEQDVVGYLVPTWFMPGTYQLRLETFDASGQVLRGCTIDVLLAGERDPNAPQVVPIPDILPTATPIPTATATVTPSVTWTATATHTPTATPTATMTFTPTALPPTAAMPTTQLMQAPMLTADQTIPAALPDGDAVLFYRFTADRDGAVQVSVASPDFPPHLLIYTLDAFAPAAETRLWHNGDDPSGMLDATIPVQAGDRLIVFVASDDPARSGQLLLNLRYAE